MYTGKLHYENTPFIINMYDIYTSKHSINKQGVWP